MARPCFKFNTFILYCFIVYILEITMKEQINYVWCEKARRYVAPKPAPKKKPKKK